MLVTIGADGKSEAIDCRDKKLTGIYFPHGILSSSISFEVKQDEPLNDFTPYFLFSDNAIVSRDIPSDVKTNGKGGWTIFGVGDFYPKKFLKIVLDNPSDEGAILGIDLTMA